MTYKNFYVVNNKIYDPQGNPFVVKGMNALHGPWLPDDSGGYALSQYQFAQRDFDAMKDIGINLVRVWVSANLFMRPENGGMRTQLNNVVNWAKQRGLVVEITNALNETDGPDSQGIHDTNTLMRYLATTYKDNPYVWIEPLNEPECESASGQFCGDWAVWHTEHTQFIQTIRDAGFSGPIVVNTPRWSWYLTNIDAPAYALHDINLIYAVHRYGNNNQQFWGMDNMENGNGLPEPLDADQAFANYSSTHAVIVDEFGLYNAARFVNSLAWIEGFIDYLTNWVNTKNGSGAVAFLWFWSDPNSATGTDITTYKARIQLTPWASYYNIHYLQKVPASKWSESHF